VLLGTEWIVDASGCSVEALCDERLLRSLCERIVAELNLIVVGEPQWRQFSGPGGVTGLYLLSESHLACHTYPEHVAATFNLYCCRERAEWDWERAVRDTLGATEIRIMCVSRGDMEASRRTTALARGAAP
jgi:S-adenosylmethionine decarboxylase